VVLGGSNVAEEPTFADFLPIFSSNTHFSEKYQDTKKFPYKISYQESIVKFRGRRSHRQAATAIVNDVIRQEAFLSNIKIKDSSQRERMMLSV